MKQKILMLITLLLLGVGTALGQTITAKGRVVDENNEGVPAATIRLKSDAKKGAFTDLDGNFTLANVKQGDIILISFVGYKVTEVAAQANMGTIKIVPDQEILDEVVVVGYSTRKLAATSASVVKVGAKDLEQKPIANPFDAVQGKVAGLQVFSSSGEPSAVSSIRLHGSGSLGASDTPLYVLDGVPVGAGTVMAMNPSDFESFQVLKDATATSIYGARAANGVIYITTKKGKMAERGLITVRAQYGVSNLANKKYYESLMNTKELTDLYREIDYWNDPDDPNATENEIAKILESGIDTKWHEYYFKKNVPMVTADVAFSGASEKSNYYISTGLLKQKGLRYRSGYERYNLRANLNSTLNDYLKVGLNSAITYDISETNPYGSNNVNGGLASLAYPWYSPYDKDGKEYYGEKIPGWKRYSPRYLADKYPSESHSLAVLAAGNITVTPFEGMTLRSQIGLELSDGTSLSVRYPSFADAIGNGSRSRGFSRDINWTITNTAEYRFNIAKDHSMSVLLGQEYIDSKYEGFNASGNGLVDDQLILLSSTTKDKSVSESYTDYSFLSFFSQISYDYAQKYFLDLTLRNDQSSRFGANKKNGTFWSVGLLWNAKKEDFLKDASWLNDLRVKASIGTSGNAGIGNYVAKQLVGKYGQYNNAVSWGILQPGNVDLTWENQRKTTIGFEARFWDRISMNLEFYDRLTSSMLMDVPYPGTSGFSSVAENVGKYQNRGIDLRIDADLYTNKTNGNYVSMYGNFNYNRDKVVELFRGLNSWTIPNTGVTYVVGKPVMFYYPIWKGVNPDTGAPQWYLPGEDRSITNKDDKAIFTPAGEAQFSSEALEQNTGIVRNAPINGGWGLNAQFYGFTFQADFAFTIGKHLISNDDYFFSNSPYTFGMNVRKEVADFWRKPGDNSKFPSLDYTFTEFDSRMIKNASFMRLKNLTIGYQLPKSILAKQNVLKSGKIYVTGRNLLTLTKFDGVDPEIDNNLTLGANPNTKQVSFGVEFSF